MSRWPLYASLAVLGAECTACFFAGSAELGDREHMVGINSAEASEQARFAIELYAIGAVNLLASIGLLLRRSGWGWWLGPGMQVGIFVFALIEGIFTDADDIGWFWFSGLPLLTLFLLFIASPARHRFPSLLRQSS